MRSEEVEALAKKKIPLPDDALDADKLLYRRLTMLYAEYRNGTVSLDIAKREKAKLFGEHDEFELKERIYKQHYKRIGEMNVIVDKARKEHSCPLCLRMFEIFAGLPEGAIHEETENDS